jgi:hypothetical protein
MVLWFVNIYGIDVLAILFHYQSILSYLIIMRKMFMTLIREKATHRERKVFPPFQIISRPDFSRYIDIKKEKVLPPFQINRSFYLFLAT